MAKVLGIGGVFFKARDPKHLASWYETWLGLAIDPSFGGTSFPTSNLPDRAYSVWSPFSDSKPRNMYASPSFAHRSKTSWLRTSTSQRVSR